MDRTDLYNYKLPSKEDKVNIDDINDNFRMADSDLQKILAMLSVKAPINSPNFNGIVTINNNTVATTNEVESLINVENLDEVDINE